MKNLFQSGNKFRNLIFLLGLVIISSCTNKQSSRQNEEVMESTMHGAPPLDYSKGEAVYNRTCLACHQANGQGIKPVFPPLANSDYLLEDIDRAIAQLITGSEGEITVNGEVYDGIMPPQELTDQEMVQVMNYVLNSWGNDGGKVDLERVQTVRKSLGH